MISLQDKIPRIEYQSLTDFCLFQLCYGRCAEVKASTLFAKNIIHASFRLHIGSEWSSYILIFALTSDMDEAVV